jgi:putative colanic acid biosynthesis glycosyltransferase WcaI
MAEYIVVDFAGHGFQFELSRALARRGHAVTHTWCSSNLTPHGDLRSVDGVDAVPINSGGSFEKYRLPARVRSEIVYGLRTAALLWRARPDSVLASNVPLLSLLLIAIAARLRGARWVLWLQDIQTGLATQSLSGSARVATSALGSLERLLIRQADAVVVIDDRFVAAVLEAGADPPTVIRNWAVIDDLPLGPRSNAWAREHGLDPERLVFLYAGTVGRKHPPELLVALAEELPDAQIVVVSEGVGADWLAAARVERGLENLVLLPFQPHEDLADVLATADVLVAVLHAAAGGFSVPSKVLSYLCAGRPVLAAMPIENGAARIVACEAHAGVVVAPTVDAIRAAAAELAADSALRDRFGMAARAYAEANFDVDEKAAAFAAILDDDADSAPDLRGRNAVRTAAVGDR